MDILLINYNQSVAEPLRQNYTGIFGFVTFDATVTALYTGNFEGSDCTEFIPGFIGPNCDEIDDHCVKDGVSCGSGRCLDGNDSYSCTCDPGFTGEFCQII